MHRTAVRILSRSIVLAVPAIKKTSTIFCGAFQDVSVKYIPFCFMQGYERYVINLAQTTLLHLNGILCLRARMRKGMLLYLIASVLGCLLRYTDITRLKDRSPEELVRDAFIFFKNPPININLLSARAVSTRLFVRNLAPV